MVGARGADIGCAGADGGRMVPSLAKTSNSVASFGAMVGWAAGACAVGVATGCVTGGAGGGGGGGAGWTGGASGGGVGVATGGGADFDIAAAAVEAGLADVGRGVHGSPKPSATGEVVVVGLLPDAVEVVGEDTFAGVLVRESCSEALAMPDASTVRVAVFVGAGRPLRVLFFSVPLGPAKRPGLAVLFRTGVFRPNSSS